MPENYLELKNITFKYPKSNYNIFEGFSLKLSSKDDIVGIVGPNGSGKTALARILTGLVKIQSGNVFLFEKDITKLRTTKRIEKILLSFQMMNNAFITSSIEDEINYNFQLKTKLVKNTYLSTNSETYILDFFKNKLKQHPLTLSGGEKRKLSFQLLRIINPEVYILDEPTVGLDYYGVKELQNEIFELQKQKKKIIIISHDVGFLLSLVNSCVILIKQQEAENTVIAYQGSLENYLLNNFNSAQKFLNIPIEFSLYIDKYSKNKQHFNQSYFEFLQSEGV